MTAQKIGVILFDLGGVLVELSGMPLMLSWTSLPETEVWKRWLTSDTVRAFESGRSSADEFATGVVSEFDLPVSPDEFIDRFIAWPRGPFEGAIELLDDLSGQFHLACLSNTNHLHWERFEQDNALLSLLHSHFASHLIGKMKPDPGIFHHVIDALDCDPGGILFLDDNQVNVDSALSAGMLAERVSGVSETKAVLSRVLGPGDWSGAL